MPIPHMQNNNSWRDNNKKPSFVNKKKSFADRHKKTAGDFFSRLNFKKNFLIYALSSLLVFGLIVVGFVLWLSKDLPNPNQLINREIAQSTKIYDRTGETILYEIHGDEKRTLINLDEIPDYVEQATIAVEDKNFYKHSGFSFFAILRTAITNVLFGKKAGGSTLTQQFVKNSVLTNEKTYTRKIKELILAYRLEKKFSKNEILQMYLNEIPYGSTSYGVEAASQRYFGKNVKNITLAEAAVLAALPQAPSRYSPYGTNLELLMGRQEHILDLMVEQGYITKDQADEAKKYPLEFQKQDENIKAPHFVMYIKELLAEKYGEKIIEQGGLKIYTSLDLYKQTIAEEVLKEQAEKNLTNYKATNASLVSIDPKTGEVLAMVGSKDYFSKDIDGQVNIALSNRQPGSSMKPLVYAASFLKGYSPNTMLYDVVTNFSNDPAKSYEPHNYDSKEHGPVSMRMALAGSLNTPAVKAMYLAGIDNVLDLADKLGYSTLKDKDRFGLSLVLGGGEVKLLEHVNAYSAFARDGAIHSIKPILRIEDANGNIMEEFKDSERQVLDPNVARMTTDILSDNNARAYIFGIKNWLTFSNDRPVAAKSGTTNDYRDAWTIGYTPSIVTGVWVGNNDNSEMKRGADGGVVAAPIWNKYMKKILGDTPIEYFKKPEIKSTGKAVLDGGNPLEKIVLVDKTSGLLASSSTPPEYVEERKFIDPHSILYYVNKDNPAGPIPTNPANDPQFNLWETAIKTWADKQNFATSSVPTEIDNIHTLENQPTLTILSPVNNETITNPILTATIEAQAKRTITRVEYYINDNLFYTNTLFPYKLEKAIHFLPNGFYNLRVKICDDVENCKSETIEFNLKLANNKNVSPAEISLTNPQANAVISNSGFPLNISVNINDIDQVTKINFYYLNDKNTATLISSLQNENVKTEAIRWAEIPATGSYKLYSEAVLWSGKLIKSDEVSITINNTEIKN
ncbi:penicillin-binding protein [Candidatus Parcubacteria bacterium]|nr:penicillin-binding protein [Patescibacteria group bacterium]MBU4309704.1 penicillin-binding protein [Patescibacteria group bacterium]MBU4431672.1 penicillin-binding protein [Patescibacteria group bacterium]MBU4577908.1 penicillin-binding protein [Patescibacteria group bacterium]MCG2696582.1 penicillin-binding protein [Candidatus Parcubacteria bacterium]